MVSIPKKLFRVGEISQHTGLSRQTLHHYTLLGLIRESERTEAGHRLYEEDVFYRLEKIVQLKKQSCTLTEIRDTLRQMDG